MYGGLGGISLVLLRNIIYIYRYKILGPHNISQIVFIIYFKMWHKYFVLVLYKLFI